MQNEKESLICEIDFKNLKIGDIVLLNLDEEYISDFGIVIDINEKEEIITVFDCYFNKAQCFNIAEYKNFKFLNIKNILNTVEYFKSLER